MCNRPFFLPELVVIAIFFSNHVFGDTIYRSISPDGRVIYSDQPPSTGKIEKVYSFENLPASPVPEAVERYRKQLEKGMKDRHPATTTTGTQLYSATWCGYCRKAKAYLGARSIPYQEIDIDTSEGKQAFVMAGGSGGIPLLLSNGKRIQGFTDSAYDNFFR
ncbi:MAG: glutaredoxin family protein [Betaproteobacteria bacterium]|nr:glutaredoxin family protein [Betaproteobacteria bacterium]